MKGLTSEKNPNLYNGEVLESHQSSNHKDSSQVIDNQLLISNKKVYIEGYVCL